MREASLVEIYEKAQEAEKAGDLERAMRLYVAATYFHQAARLAQESGRTNEAIQYFLDGGDNFSANRLAQEHGLPIVYLEGEIVNVSTDILENLSESLYITLSGQRGKAVGFNGLYGNVLDVGCRDGRFFRLLERFGAETVYGVDLDLQALIEARQKPEVNPTNVYDCKVEELPSELNRFFDYATIFNFSLGGKEERERAVDSIVRILKPSGRILATFTTLDELRNYSPEISRYFSAIQSSLINGSIERDSAPHRYVLHGVRK